MARRAERRPARRDREERTPRRRQERPRGRGRADWGYKRRDPKVNERRASMRGGDFDRPVRDDVKLFQANDGRNKVRILPPTWDEAEDYCYEVWMHYGVGPDNSSYICRSRMLEDDCPICEEVLRARQDGEDEDYVNGLKPKRRMAVYLVDRDHPDDGPQVWMPSWTFIKDLCTAARDEETNETLDVDHPEEGYDVKFNREGQGKRTRYTAVMPVRRPSFISEDEEEEADWCRQIQENPIPDVLVFYDYDHVRAAFDGRAARRGGDEDEEERPVRTRRRPSRDVEEDDEDEAPRRSRRERPSRDRDLDEDPFEGEEEDALEARLPDDDEDPEPEEDEDDDYPRRGRGRRSSERTPRSDRSPRSQPARRRARLR